MKAKAATIVFEAPKDAEMASPPTSPSGMSEDLASPYAAAATIPTELVGDREAAFILMQLVVSI